MRASWVYPFQYAQSADELPRDAAARDRGAGRRGREAAPRGRGRRDPPGVRRAAPGDRGRRARPPGRPDRDVDARARRPRPLGLRQRGRRRCCGRPTRRSCSSRPPATTPGRADRPLRVLVPLDGSDLAEEVADRRERPRGRARAPSWCSSASSTRAGPRPTGVQIVSAPPSYVVAYQHDPEAELAHARHYLEDVAERLHGAAPVRSVRAEVGAPAATIAAVARDEGVDLIAMATHGRAGLSGLLMGSTAAATLQRAGVPVLLVRPAAARQPAVELAPPDEAAPVMLYLTHQELALVRRALERAPLGDLPGDPRALLARLERDEREQSTEPRVLARSRAASRPPRRRQPRALAPRRAPTWPDGSATRRRVVARHATSRPIWSAQGKAPMPADPGRSVGSGAGNSGLGGAPVLETRPTGEFALLRDGGQVLIRPVVPDDLPAIQALFERLSAESRLMRFHSAGLRVEGDTLARVTAGHALVAELGDQAAARPGGLVGLASYVRLRDPERAEMAIAVDDAQQGRGIGTALFERLSDDARREGIARFLAIVMSGNGADAAHARRARLPAGPPPRRRRGRGRGRPAARPRLRRAPPTRAATSPRPPRCGRSCGPARSPSSAPRASAARSATSCSATCSPAASTARSTRSTRRRARSRACAPTRPSPRSASRSTWPSSSCRPRACSASPASASTPACAAWS